MIKHRSFLSISLLLFVLSCTSSALAAVVSHIEVTGNRKIEKEAVLAKLVTKSGANFSEENVREDIQNIFKTGFFYNVEVFKSANGKELDLTYKVTEKPSIEEIHYEGISELKEDEIAEASGIKAFEIINQAKIKEAVDKIQKLYEDKGFFLAKVDAKVVEIKKDETVRLNFVIQENDKVKVRKVTFLGNHAFSDATLKEHIQTQEGGFFSFMSGSGSYIQERFDIDVQLLDRFYKSRGYVLAKIDRPQVYVTPDKKSIYITMHVDEGDQFFVGDVDFGGDLLFSKEELYETTELKPGDVFNIETMVGDMDRLKAKYGDLGYAYVNVIPNYVPNEKERKVNLSYGFEKGNKVYFGRINVIGNTRTRDKVVRRELKVREGELYNYTRFQQSKEGVQRLGFFEDGVNFRTASTPEKPDIMNVDIVVKERNTGQLQASAGYSNYTGAQFQLGVNQANFLGKGQNLGVNIMYSQAQKTFGLSFAEPYVNDSDWSMKGDLYKTQGNLPDYIDNRLGAAITVGHPLLEDLNLYVKVKDETVSLEPVFNQDGSEATDETIFPIHTMNGEIRSLTLSTAYDKRNDRMQPSKGIFGSVSYEYAGFAGQVQYSKLMGSFKWYKKVFWEVVWRNSVTYGQLDSLDSVNPPPFTETFKLGGPYSLRGYNSYSVGRRLFSNTAYLALKPYYPYDADIRAYRLYGGTRELFYLTELEYPLIQEVGIKGVVFYDIGQAEDTIRDGNFLSDAGFGIRWFSPIGPLRFEWGFPFNRRAVYDDAVQFQFSVGSSF